MKLEYLFVGIISLLFIVLLVVPGKQKHAYKCMKNILGPNKGTCIRVNESPDPANGLHKTAKDCLHECSSMPVPAPLPPCPLCPSCPSHELGQVGYKCMKDVLGPGHGVCMKVDEAPNHLNGVYASAEECVSECSPVHPDMGAFGYKCMKNALGENKNMCVRVNEAPNKKNGVFSDVEECQYACSSVKPVHPDMGAFGYKCMKNALGENKNMCVRVNEAPNKKNGVFSDAEECLYSCHK
jgi:hypothetical protein